MFRFFRLALVAALAIIAGSTAVMAQQMPELPVDKDVRIGKLSNGLTYYIRHNEKPKGQADFYIAQKVGSVLENDQQRGLAHFLEHMCFNGTTHFPGSSLRDWLETKGVKFGTNLNAYTSFDETVYNISNVPVADKAVQDSCLLILHDWANDLTLDPEEIEKERGVIHQEWRTTNKGQMRIIEQLLPVIFPNNVYGMRLPIGTMEIVDNFPPQDLRDYYETWYRPDQQGIIVVGDIDVDYIEGKIKEMFADIEMPANAPERKYVPVDDNEGTIFAIGKDKEMDAGVGIMMFKTDAFPDSLKSNPMYLVQKYALNMLSSMLRQRLSDIASTPDSPFASASPYYGNFFVAKTKDALSLEVVAKDDDILPAMETAYRELLRAQRGGFTVGEYERARSEYLSRLEKAYNSRDSRENGQFVSEYVDNFTDNEPIPSLEDEYGFLTQVVPMIPVEAINQTIADLVTDDNRVIMVLAPENDTFKVPTQQDIEVMISAVNAENIEPYQDAMKAEPLIPQLPAPGKIVSITDDAQWGAKVITLSNGVKVVVKPTDFKKDEIRFDAIAVSGISKEPDSNINSIIAASLIEQKYGLGDYSNTDLKRYLQGKQAAVGFSISEYNRDLSGNTTVKDLPYLMEMIYMTFTNVSSTPDEYAATQNNLITMLKQAEANPQVVFSKNLQNTLYEAAAKKFITVPQIQSADREAGLKLVHDYFSNAADFTFFFVGDIDMETLKPLLEQYIATLPADPANAVKTYEPNPRYEAKSGTATDVFTMKMETPQTTCMVLVEGEMPYTPKNRQMASVVGQILSNRLIKTIREEMGAVYSIFAQSGMMRQGKYNTLLQIPFPMKPEAREEVLSEINKLITDMTQNIAEEELAPVKEYMVKNVTEAKEKNSEWIGSMSATALNGVDIFNGSEEIINSISTDDVKAFMKDLLDQGNYRVILLDPEN